MEHLTFCLLSLIALLVNGVLATLYSYNITTNIYLTILLKISPIIVLNLLILSYFFIYRSNIYAVGIMMTLILCMIGDIFMCLYPRFLTYSLDSFYYIIVGGILFLCARILMCGIFLVEPYRDLRLLKYSWKKSIISHILFTIPGLSFGIFILVQSVSFLTISIFVYLFLGFGFPLSFAFLRIFSEIKECLFSKILGFLAILFFNISDLLLFLTMLGWIPSYVDIISINIYWLSMYLLTISIVRSSKEHIEQGTYLSFLHPSIMDI